MGSLEEFVIRPFLRLTAAIAIVLFSAARAGATPVSYTFDAPNFTDGENTPLLNRAPNVNPGTFLTSFTASTDANAFQVANFQPNPLFQGESLYEPIGVSPIDNLLLAFNTPVFSLGVSFGINVPATGAPGVFRLTTPVGVQTVTAANVGGTFEGGLLTFVSATPFLNAQFSAFNAAGAPIEFAIDNLRLDTAAVPEPATIGLVLSGLGFAMRRRRKS